MAFPKTRENAKQLVQRIAAEHGHISSTTLVRWDPQLSREREEDVLEKDSVISSSIST